VNVVRESSEPMFWRSLHFMLGFSSVFVSVYAQPPAGGGAGGGPPAGGPPGMGGEDTGNVIATEPHFAVNADKQCTLTSTGPQTITGYIYCDNYFEFWFNGELVAKDPMTFTPHNAVQVSFEWDGVSDKEYAIMCMDYASTSGYEYIETDAPQLGDGVLMAEFSDGTVTSSAWSVFVVTSGPTDASIEAGCSATNLDVCVVDTLEEPTGWVDRGFAVDGAWSSATEYTAAVAGWGRTPAWNASGSCCGTATSPRTQAPLTENGGCSVNYATSSPNGLSTSVGHMECLDPMVVLSELRSTMIWSSDLQRDNRVLFRVTVPADRVSSSVQCPVCDAAVQEAGSQRVRRELRTLTSEEWNKVTAAMWIMKTTSREDGVAAYGAAFRTYDTFVVKHAVAESDPRGDQAHSGPMFMTWHSAFVLEFENALLSVDPSIVALPYWDASIVEPSIFTDVYFGSAPGTGPGGEVVDGVFKNWPITSNFSLSDYKTAAGDAVVSPFAGSQIGMLRGSSSTRTESVALRFGSSAYTFASNDYWKCSNLDGYWNDWYQCAEAGTAGGLSLSNARVHGGAHQGVGGKSGTDSSDFEDPTTSPNDPIFFFHHANVDRSAFHWMAVNTDKRSTFYGYPAEDATGAGPTAESSYYGQSLLDKMSDAWGFSAQDLGLSDSTDSQTNADILCRVAPPTAVYTYDSLVACATGDSAPCTASWEAVVEATTTPPSTTMGADDSTTVISTTSGNDTSTEAGSDQATASNTPGIAVFFVGVVVLLKMS